MRHFYWVGIALGLTFAGCTKSTPYTQMWKVTSGDKVGYLLGSIHIGQPSFYPLDTAIERAFSGAGCLLVELSPEQSRLNSTFINKPSSLVHSPLGAQLTPAMKEDVISFFHAVLGVCGSRLPYRPEKILAVFGPSYITIDEFGENVFDLLNYCTDYSGMHGIDAYFISRAQGSIPVFQAEPFKGGRRIVVGSNVQTTTDALAPWKDEKERSLNKSVNVILRNLNRAYEGVWKNWHDGLFVYGDSQSIRKAQDAKRLNIGFFGVAEDSDDGLSERNYYMADRFVRRLENGECPFMVAGALHMVGPEGVVAQLLNKGYVVEGVRKEGRNKGWYPEKEWYSTHRSSRPSGPFLAEPKTDRQPPEKVAKDKIASWNKMALEYEKGRGRPVDLGQAAFYYEKAANAGNPAAMVFIAKRHWDGDGIPVNRGGALVWARRAALLGNEYACIMAAKLYSEGVDGPPDMAWAHAYFKAAKSRAVLPDRHYVLMGSAPTLTQEQLRIAKDRYRALEAVFCLPN